MRHYLESKIKLENLKVVLVKAGKKSGVFLLFVPRFKHYFLSNN